LHTVQGLVSCFRGPIGLDSSGDHGPRTSLHDECGKEITMALDAQPLTSEARSAARPRTIAPRGRGARVRQPARAAVRRRFDEAALAAAIRELRTHRRTGVPG
jgi:hypothetical protein